RLSGGVVFRHRQPTFLRRLVGGRGGVRRGRGVLRAPVDVGLVAVRGVAVRGRGPIHGAVQRRDGEPRADRRQSVRPGDALRRRGDGFAPVAELETADGPRLGPRLAALLQLRERDGCSLPRGLGAPGRGNRMRTRPRSVLGAIAAADRASASSGMALPPKRRTRPKAATSLTPMRDKAGRLACTLACGSESAQDKGSTLGILLNGG